MQTTKHRLNSTVQLVNLNDDLVNFELEWSTTSKNNVPFEVAVVDQQFLDSGEEFQFTTVEDNATGQLVEDENNQKAYSLALRSKGDCHCEVSIRKREISPRQPRQPETPHPINPPSIHPPEKPKTINWKLIFVVLLVTGGIFILYYLFCRKKKLALQNEPSQTWDKPVLSADKMIIPSPVPSPVLMRSPIASPVVAPVIPRINNDILRRLNDL